ncbi:MAG: hypothetical protein J6C23_06400 [Clostridia bacterium]|nr:hypothetical protein [Clostridia bacterium]
MDKALFEDIKVSAYEIAQDYKKENLFREYSRNKKIRCADPDCKQPIVRYCHGDKKSAYFAHLTNTDCDYDRFDKKDNSILKQLRIKLFEHFTSLGYKVETECKLLEHHYSPVFCVKENESFVIEFGSPKTTKGYVDKLLREYSFNKISVKWIVVGSQNFSLKENEVSYLKRFLWNESKNNDFILVDGDEVVQYRWDKKELSLNDDIEIYYEKDILGNLIVVDGELSIDGYGLRFEDWKKNKEIKMSQEIEKNQAMGGQKRKNLIDIQVCEQYDLYKESSIESNITYNSSCSFSNSQGVVFTCCECGKKMHGCEFYETHVDGTGICNECVHNPEIFAKIIKRLQAKR